MYPADRNDAVTLIHDIEYLLYSGNPDMTAKSDELAIRESSEGWEGTLIKAGLGVRLAMDLDFNPVKTPYDHQLGQYLKNYVQTNDGWVDVLKPYQLSWVE